MLNGDIVLVYRGRNGRSRGQGLDPSIVHPITCTPSLKRGSGGLVWWKCLRCHGQDVFLRMRPASVAPIAEVGDTGNFMVVQREVLVDVWVCRSCGEIATKSWRSLTESEIAADKA